MSYFFMSNINDFDNFSSKEDAYVSVSTNDTITFESDGINYKASFLMVRAHEDNDLLIQILPYNYGVYIPATEMWSVDSLKDISGIVIKKAFDNNLSSINTAKIQWMIGYK